MPRKTTIVVCFFLLFCQCGLSQPRASETNYHILFPKNECDANAFRMACVGYNYLKAKGLLNNLRYLSIIDFTKPSNQQRFFVIDMVESKLVVASITAHGVGSDPDSLSIPYRFSNTDNSYQSSLGFYLTGSRYVNTRKADSLGLCLFGLDEVYNSNAAAREIVLHYGASERTGNVYVTDSGAARSYGCPALPLSTNAKIINLIQGGSCMFIYSDTDKNYATKSTVLNQKIFLPINQEGPSPNNCRCTIREHGEVKFTSSLEKL